MPSVGGGTKRGSSASIGLSSKLVVATSSMEFSLVGEQEDLEGVSGQTMGSVPPRRWMTATNDELLRISTHEGR